MSWPPGRLPISVFLATAAAYGAIIFGVFPREPFLKYPVLASQSLAGTLSSERWLDLSPFYLAFHQILAALGAPPGSAEVCQILAVALATALLAATLQPRVGLGVAVAVCGLFAASGALITYTATLEPEAFLVLAVTVFLWALSGDPRRPWVAGVALAVAGLLRPNLLLLAGLVPLGFWLEARGRGPAEWREARRSGWAVASPVLLGVALLLARNAALPGPFTPFVMNPGTVFFEGNQPWAEGTAATYPPLFPELAPGFAKSPDPQHELYRLFARRATGRELSVAEVNDFWRQRAQAFVLDHPFYALRRAGRKFLAMLSGYSWHDLASAHWNERLLGRAPSLAAGLLLAAAFFGLAPAVARRWVYLPVLGVILLQVSVALGLYASARQRLAAWPALAVLAGLALAQFRAQGGTLDIRRLRFWGKPLLVLCFAGVLTFGNRAAGFDQRLFTAIEASSQLEVEARELRRQGRLAEAADHAARGLSETPWRAERLRLAYLSFGALGFEGTAARSESPFERGLLQLAGSRSAAAEAAFVLSLAFEGRWDRWEATDSSEPHYYRALARHGEAHDGVQAALAAGIARTPGDPEILAAQFVLDGDEAARTVLFRYWDPLTANFFIGRQALRFGRPAACLEPLRFVHERLPELRRGAIYLAACLAAVGRPEEGARVFEAANHGSPEPVLLEPEIRGLFRALVERHPLDPTTLRLAAVVERQYGHYAEALTLFERLDRVTGGTDPRVAEALRQVRAGLEMGAD